MSRPSCATWKVQSQTGFDGLVFDEDVALPDKLEDHDCLIAIEATSLNYRDITIPMVSPQSSRLRELPPTTNALRRELTLSPYHFP
jgi:hypothetical protein